MKWLSSFFRKKDPIKVSFQFSKENDFIASVDATTSLKALSHVLKLEGEWTDGNMQAIHPQHVVAFRESLVQLTDNPKYEVTIDQQILQIQLLPLQPEDFRFMLVWDRERMEAVCFPPESSEVWGGGWFLFKDRIFRIGGWTSRDDLWVQSPIPSNRIIDFLSNVLPDVHRRGIPLDSSIQVQQVPIFYLAIAEVTEESIRISLQRNCKRPEIVPGLTDYVLADHDQFFPSPYQDNIEQFLLSCERQGRDQFILKGQQIPYLLDHMQRWSCYLRGDLDALHSIHRMLFDCEFLLESVVEYDKGIGSVYGIPVIGSADRRVKGLEVHFSYRARERYIFHPEGWIPVRMLADKGLLESALSIAKVELTPAEIILQQSHQFDQMTCIIDLPVFPERDAASHLKALLQYGVHGGIACGENVWLSASYHILMDLVGQHPNLTILLVGHKDRLEGFSRGWQGPAVTWLTDEDRLKTIPTVVAVTPYIAGKNRFISERHFDLCIFLAPEEIAKTESSKVFEWMRNIRARLRLSFYAGTPEALNVKLQAAILGYRDISLAQKVIYPATFGNVVASWMQEEGASVYLQTPEQIFVTLARQFGDIMLTSPKDTAPAGYEKYLPQLTAAEASSYFYWRAESRAGRYQKTSLFCVFMYIYELINGIGWTEPMNGQRQLIMIWKLYRSEFPELASYLIDWIVDFSFVHGVNLDIMDVVAGYPEYVSKFAINEALRQRLQETPARIPSDILFQLCDDTADYDPSIREQIEFHLPRIIGWYSNQFHKEHGVSLSERFEPSEQESVQRIVFQHAMHAGSERTIEHYSVPYLDNKPLREWVSGIIRYAENKIRLASSMKARYRQTSLTPYMQQCIDQYFTAYQAQALRKERNIQINEATLLSLQEDTEQVQQMLSITDSAEPEEDPPPMILTMPEEELLRTEGGESWGQVRQRLQPIHAQLLTLILQGASAAELVQVAAAHSTMLELLLDEINEIAMETLGDLLIDETDIVEEYRELINLIEVS